MIAILCTHAHDDHVRVAPELAAAVEAPIWLHPDDRPVWDLTHDAAPDADLADGQQIPIGDIALEVLHTPGHSPGAVCFYSRTWAWCSPATRCSTVAPAPPAAASATRT